MASSILTGLTVKKFSSIKKAAFGCLQETVRSLHLLTAVLDIKNPLPASNISIKYCGGFVK